MGLRRNVHEQVAPPRVPRSRIPAGMHRLRRSMIHALSAVPSYTNVLLGRSFAPCASPWFLTSYQLSRGEAEFGTVNEFGTNRNRARAWKWSQNQKFFRARLRGVRLLGVSCPSLESMGTESSYSSLLSRCCAILPEGTQAW